MRMGNKCEKDYNTEIIRPNLISINPLDPDKFFRNLVLVYSFFPRIWFADFIRPKCFQIFEYNKKYDDPKMIFMT